MRPTKNRSRGKPNNRNNNNRSATSVINRVFDSSGPEGKVRGTPQQIIEKYNQLARDAQLSNDRVAAENFQQHAEHYTRLLGAAQKEIDAQREQQEREQNERRERQEAERAERNERHAKERRERQEAAEERVGAGEGEQPEVSQTAPADSGDAETNLVETPEEAPKPKRARAPRKPRRPRVQAEASEAPAAPEQPTAAAPTPSEAPAEPKAVTEE
jgi:hypothetical protein